MCVAPGQRPEVERVSLHPWPLARRNRGGRIVAGAGAVELGLRRIGEPQVEDIAPRRAWLESGPRVIEDIACRQCICEDAHLIERAGEVAALRRVADEERVTVP